MQTNNSEHTSETNSHDWLELDLPIVTTNTAPVAHPPPPSPLAFRHSLKLLRSTPEAVWTRRRQAMNPKRFVLVEFR